MDNNQRRFFEYYHTGVVPSQVTLFNRLEQLGYEVNGKHILSTGTVGVPVTVMLLLMHDSYQDIVLLQSEMMAYKSHLGRESTDKMVEDTGLKLLKTLKPDVENVYWSKDRTNIDISTTASGSTQNLQADMYTPETQIASPLSDYFSSDDEDAVVSNQTIVVPDRTANPLPNIDIFRPLFSFIEFTYAIGERVHYEVKQFNQLLGKQVSPPMKGSKFTSMNGRRTALTHEGNIKVKIDPANSSIRLSGRLMDEEMKKTFDEVGAWVETTYASMIHTLT